VRVKNNLIKTVKQPSCELSNKCTQNNHILQQKSTILQAENGWTSNSKRTRHPNLMSFFVTNNVKMGEIKVVFCPTTNTLADFFTITTTRYDI